jgi:hypothetical protein
MPDRLRGKPSDYFAAASRTSGTPVSHLISIRLPDDLMQRLAAVGNEEGLAMSDTIRLVLERGLAAKPTAGKPSTAAKRKRRT